MKLFQVFVVSLFLSTSLFAEEVIIDSKIKNVTVFLKGAQVNREAKFSVNAGVHQIIVSGVSQFVDPQSIQIKGTNGIIILDSKFTRYYSSPGSKTVSKLPKSVQLKINAVEDSLSYIAFEISNLDSELEVLKASKSIILGNGAMRGQGKVNDSIQLLKQAVEYYLSKVKSLNKEINEISRRKKLKTLQLNSLQSRLNELKNYSNNEVFQENKTKSDYRIVVTISSDKVNSGYLDLTYLVSNAGWNAQYDLISNVESSKINLNYKAQIYQSTGIDWKDVRLSVSTNDPYKNKTKPELLPWVLGVQPFSFQQRQAHPNQTQSLSEVAVRQSDSKFKKESIEERNFDYSTSAQHTQVVQHLISAEFKIDLPYSIKSNGEKHMVLVKNEDVDANYVYYTVPKVENSAYLVARITNLEELQLIPAKATIFFDGSYMGETHINPTTMDDTLSLSLGKDPNIIVKRTFINKKYKEKIIGSEVEKSSLYQLEILNNKSKSIDIIVQDQVPVSRKEGIEITAEEISNGSLNETTGIIEWKLELKSKERKTLDLMYKVKHNKNEPLVLR
ncbi:hypothetical protein CW751_06670 [Brumimicrobium salinarum]|uniref:Mucoidy inhibitor MuiA family protein n=1 Tax=Brumimicrobium salinarum TaxID=2058658 RepID=A0A2I0R3B7_9FLAO|nr:DUF4139 domain-containing protein [Brumimicrobium salinarum]PKR81055.1 hypothetical protein CW751_06670 [Brumimicrobium salinarum]